MAAPRGNFRGLAAAVDCGLRPRQAARWLHRHAAHDRFTAANAAQHATVAVGRCADLLRAIVLGHEGVVVLAAAHAGHGKAGHVVLARQTGHRREQANKPETLGLDDEVIGEALDVLGQQILDRYLEGIFVGSLVETNEHLGEAGRRLRG